MTSLKRFQKIREINVCHMYIRFNKKTKTYVPYVWSHFGFNFFFLNSIFRSPREGCAANHQGQVR